MKNNDNKNIVLKQIDKYDRSANRYGISSKAVYLSDQQKQYYRFFELIDGLDMDTASKTVLDIGCGNAELYRFLNLIGFRGSYSGFDINKKLLGQAKKRFPGIDVSQVDIMEQKAKKQYDYVVMSGLFNLNTGQTKEWVFAFLKRMFSYSRDKMVFNAVSTHVNFYDRKMFYLNPEEILSYCIKYLSQRTTIKHGNLPYNYTVMVSKADKWQSVTREA